MRGGIGAIQSALARFTASSFGTKEPLDRSPRLVDFIGISDMDRLWAPWRAQYIQDSSAKPSSPVDPCFLCRGLASDPSNDRENLLAYRGIHAAVFLNRYPYNNGHLLVAPTVHRGGLDELIGPELTAPVELVRDSLTILSRMMRPQGYNVGLNLGKSAGAGLPGHLHWHVVPRWDGDTNFMPVLGQTKVIVESLATFYDRLVEEFRNEGLASPSIA